MLYVEGMWWDGWRGWLDSMVVIGHRSSQRTFGANNKKWSKHCDKSLHRFFMEFLTAISTSHLHQSSNSAFRKVTNSEKLCLQWNDYRESIINSFRSLKDDKDLTGVTLASVSLTLDQDKSTTKGRRIWRFSKRFWQSQRNVKTGRKVFANRINDKQGNKS